MIQLTLNNDQPAALSHISTNRKREECSLDETAKLQCTQVVMGYKCGHPGQTTPTPSQNHKTSRATLLSAVISYFFPALHTSDEHN